MKICIVSNRKGFIHDYSAFADSCDIVIRISKMDNLDSGFTGSKTDITVVSVWDGYLRYSREKRHMDHLKTVPKIYFNNEEKDLSRKFAKSEGLENWEFLPQCVHDSTTNYTTLSKALCLADYLFPNDTLYYLGDIQAEVCAPRPSKHPYEKENLYIQKLIKRKRLIPIMGRIDTTCKFSDNIEGRNSKSRFLIVNPHDGHSSTFRHLGLPILGMGYEKWNFLFLLDRMYRDLSERVKLMPELESLIFMGICKNSLPAAWLVLRFKKEHPEYKLGIWGCPWIGDRSRGENEYESLLDTQEARSYAISSPYKEMLSLYGDPLTMLEKAKRDGLRVPLFSFYGTNARFRADEKNSDRLSDFITKKYYLPLQKQICPSAGHSLIFQLMKSCPEIIGRCLTEILSIISQYSEDRKFQDEVLS